MSYLQDRSFIMVMRTWKSNTPIGTVRKLFNNNYKQSMLNWCEDPNCVQALTHVVCWLPDIVLVSYSDSGCVITLKPSDKPLPNTPQHTTRTITPSFILVRSATAGVYGQDYKNILVGLLHARIPCMFATNKPTPANPLTSGPLTSCPVPSVTR